MAEQSRIPASRSGRGRPPRISRHQILDTAIELGREGGLAEVRMAAVAERLGVRPSALNYHVRDRDELIELVAGTVLDFTLDDSWMPNGQTDWRVWARALARELRRMLLAQPEMVLYFRIPLDSSKSSLRNADRAFSVFFDAGFSAELVARGLTFLAQVVFMGVRDELMSGRSGEHPQDAELRHALAAMPDNEVPHLRQYLSAGAHGRPDDQFAFDLDCVIAALEAQLTASRT